ncbi:hypothetical protein [Pseudomonas monteilii]|uniref:hypothetical protein n=1 Tax=Pseudomonas monteilii TaxID=76759 RepID=UPI001F3796F7|nr:hypothetical protein [Pseudomonas monteilii]
MRTTLLSLLLLTPLAAHALETPVDEFLRSSYGLCDARIEVSQQTFNLFDQGEFLAIERRISQHDDYAKVMRKAKSVASKSQSSRQQYLLSQFSDCINERTKVAINYLKK